MNPNTIKKTAEEFGVTLKSALHMRCRYLMSILDQWELYIDGHGELPALTAAEAFDELYRIYKYKASLKRKPSKNDVTDEMIEAAKLFPIEQIISFDRTNSAIAFCHQDKTPSLKWNRKANQARCFPCAKSFNPIDVLIERDNMTFIEAVKTLS